MLLPRIYFLKENEQLLVEDFTEKFTVNGPQVFFARPLMRVKSRKALTIGPTDYIRIRHLLTGELRNERGPSLYFLNANEEVEQSLSAIPLKRNQYVKLIDRRTGVISMVRGETSIYLSPTEEILGKVEQGINIDEETAVLVRDIESGQLQLIAEPQVFFPDANQEIVELRKRILLEDHEAVVIKNRLGQYQIRRGTDAERAFFLEPYSQLVEFCWSRGVHKDKRDLKFTRIDSRPKFMSYEFEVRTQDNVELVIAITLFWQIINIESMLRSTDDATGDVCSHARSSIIQSVSQSTLERFLSSFNDLAREAVQNPNDPFYTNRGVQIHSVEVRSISCKDPETQRILMEIIQETTNRLNQLQKQESSNEVQLRQMQGEIQAEQLKGQLLELRREHAKTEATSQGEAEAIRVRAFLEGLGEQTSTADKIHIFNMLRKQDAITALSTGNAQLYFTPADVDLSIETRP
ncbi:SPFH domain-containing protein [Allocoleopsis sp.]|uniref:SPFH domain-containing protein n=1 Tax=Allocoleopsis sp. TaxID=3088169 RepID=UPI002FCEC9D5